MAGRTPTAVTISSAAIHPPSARASPPGCTASTAVATRRSTPAAAYQRAVWAPAGAPIAAASGAGPASTTVTWLPCATAAVASSAPIQPAPTMASRSAFRGAGRSRSRSASASS